MKNNTTRIGPATVVMSLKNIFIGFVLVYSWVNSTDFLRLFVVFYLLFNCLLSLQQIWTYKLSRRNRI